MRKKKYFVGGAVNKGIQGLTQDMPGQSSQVIGGAAQLAIGAATGNPMDMIGGGVDMLSGGFNNAKEMFNNKDASFGDKALAAYGVINPMAGIVSSYKNKSLIERQQEDDAMNNVIKNNRMANGGNIQRGNPSFKKDQEVLKAKFGTDPRIKQGPNGSYYMVGTAANTGSLVPDMSNWLMPGDTINTAVPQVDSTQIIPKNNVQDVNLKGLEELIKIGNTPPSKFKRKTPKLFEGGGYLNHFDGGFTHDDNSPENSFGGIPIAVNNDGLHVVERDEVSMPTEDGNQYIYSEQNKITKNLAKQFNLANKYIGKSVAYAAKDFEKNTRKGDPIDENTLKKNTDRLMALNEQLKQINEIGEIYKMAKGGKLNINKYDGGSWLDSIYPYRQVQTTPQQGIPYRYNDQIAEQAQQSSGNNATQNTVTNYLDIQQIMQNMSPEERRSFTQKLAETKNPFGELTKMGYTPGGKGVSWQQTSAEDPFYGGVNAEILNQVSNPNLMNQVFGGVKDSYTLEDLQRLQREIMHDPIASQYIVNPEQTDFGVDWMVASSMGPDFTAKKMTGKGTDLTVTNDGQLAPVPPPKINSSGDKEEEKDPKNPPNLPNLWPELGLAGNLGAMAMLDPTYMSPSTMSTGYLRPQMIDEQTMRGSIDAANRANVGALANVTGGSGAAQRAGLLGQGVNYMGATGNAFTQANQANNAARMQADQFNIGTQGNVAGQNMRAINQANAMNTGIANQYNMEKADTFASAVGDYSVAGADRRMSNDASKFWGRATGYDPKTAQYLLAMQNGNKPVEETKASAYGGIIKTRKRKLK